MNSTSRENRNRFLIHHFTRVVSILLLLEMSAVLVAAQSAGDMTTRPDRGLMPNGAYAVSDIENINLTNGNLNLSIPLASLPPIAGGKLSFGLRAVYNSKLWNVKSQEMQLSPIAGCGGYVLETPEISDRGGWRIDAGYGIEFRNAKDDFDYHVPDPPGPGQECEQDPFERVLLQYQWYRVILTTPDGAEHELRLLDNYATYNGSRAYLRGAYKDTPATTGQTMRYYSFDGTYLTVEISPFTFPAGPHQWAIYMNDGTKITQSSGVQRIQDTNGNSIKMFGDSNGGHIQDELTGREIKTVGIGNNQMQVQYETVGGSWQHVDIIFGYTSVRGKFYKVQDWTTNGVEPPGMVCWRDETIGYYSPYEIPVIREILFPATEQGVPGRKFSFSYNSDETEASTTAVRWACGQPEETITTTSSKGYGSLSRMVTPSGAVVDYTYIYDATPGNPNHQFFLGDNFSREVISSKKITHDGITDTWAYDIALDGFGGTVQNPDGSFVVESSYPYDPAHGRSQSNGRGGLVFRTNNSDKVIVERHWALLPFTGAYIYSPAGGVAFNPVVNAEYTTLLDNNSPAQPVKMSAKTYQYDFNGNLTQVTEYDWFSPSLVTRDGDGVPTGVPASATVLRTASTSYYNGASSASSQNVYAKRALSGSTVVLNAAQQMTTGPSITQFSYDSQAFGAAPTIGNLTKVSRWDNINNRWDHTNISYGQYGNPSSITDARGNVTQMFYDDATYAQPTRVVVDPLNGTGQQTTTITYDYSTGLVTSQTDLNGNISTIDYTNQLLGSVDPFGRPGVAIGPLVSAGGTNQHRRVKTFYEDSTLRIRVEADLRAENDGLLKTRETRDQLGRTILTEQSEDGYGYAVSMQIVYEQMGRITFSSNPHRATGASTDGWTRTKKDILGRVSEIASFSGAAQPTSSATNWTGRVQTTYNANVTTVEDQAGKQRRSVTDAARRLIEVIEAPNDASYNLSTTYVYDVQNNLRKVTQGAQKRYFLYDSLSRLIRARNVEQGVHDSLDMSSDALTDNNSHWSLAYSYDANGNLTSKRDARATMTSYAFDALNRITQRSYSGGTAVATPTVTYTYDSSGVTNSKGRLTSVSSGVSTYNYLSYDALGRITASQQVTDGQTYSMSCAFDLAGNMTAQTYPTGRVVTNSFDDAGRLSHISGQVPGGTPKTYANAFGYTAHGAVERMRLGNNRWEHTLYNSRLQPTEIGLGAGPNSVSLLGLSYSYGTDNNNGNVLRQVITVPTIGTATGFTATQHYQYDQLNRLTGAQEVNGASSSWQSSGALWQQMFTYDRCGNRAVDTANTTSTMIGPNPVISTTNNRITPRSGEYYNYDDAGNMNKGQGGETLYYDAENKLVQYQGGATQSGGANYSYDGDGRRVKKATPAETLIFVYNISGQLVAEYTTSTPEQNGTSYLTGDTLGSPRLNTKADGSVRARHDYLPFGEELFANAGNRTTEQKYDDGASPTDKTRQKFTSKERDIETGLDYFVARYYSPSQGRFTSVDPALLKAKQLTNPQDLNRYSYVANNPLKYIDPDGQEKLKVVIETYIPAHDVTVAGHTFTGDYDDKGQRIEGSYRTQQVIIVETDPSKNGGNVLYENTRDTGRSYELDKPGGNIIKTDKASGETLQANVSRDQYGVHIEASGNESNPLVPSPGITGEYSVNLQSEGPQGRVRVALAVDHDRFPAHRITVTRPESGNTTREVYIFDPRSNGNGPLSLAPPAPNERRARVVFIDPTPN